MQQPQRAFAAHSARFASIALRATGLLRTGLCATGLRGTKLRATVLRAAGLRAWTLRTLPALFLLAACAACAGDGPTGSTLDVITPVTATVDTLGAVLADPTGAFELTIPKYAVQRTATVTVKPATNSLADARIIPGTAFQVLPDTLRFFEFARLKLKFDQKKLPANVSAEGLVLYLLGSIDWLEVPNATVNVAAGTVTGGIASAGTYAIGHKPIKTIRFGGALANGGLYVGQSGKLSVIIANDYNELLPRPVTWASSAPAIATVDATGSVRAIATGSTTISVTVEGKSVTATVSVLAAPTANWTRAAEWTTYQGNAQHTGYVDATIDPRSFAVRWEKLQPATTRYLQATVNGSRVFFVNEQNTQHLLALNTVDGSTAWTYSFGNVFIANQATYDSGSVYVTTGGGSNTFMYSLRESDGAFRFKTAFGSQFEGWYAPVVAGPAIVTGGGQFGGMYGFDRVNGQQLFFVQGSQYLGRWAPAVANGKVYRGYVGLNVTEPATGQTTKILTDPLLLFLATPVISGVNNFIGAASNRLFLFDINAKRKVWDQPAVTNEPPVVGNGVIYVRNDKSIDAHRESDGTLLWTFALPAPYIGATNLILTNNMLLATLVPENSDRAVTVGIDLASHLAVWEYPASGLLALSGQGVLYISQSDRLTAITMK